MNEQNRVSYFAKMLEGMLRNYLNCGYTEFGVKANDYLTEHDWKSPINFALGYKYAKSNDSPEVKQEIEDFLGNDLEGQSIGDIIRNYQYYGFSTEDDAYQHIEEMIERLKEILYS